MAEDGTPTPSSREVSTRMSRTRQRDTPGEVALRSELHRRGFRFRLQRRIEGVSRVRPDIVLVSARVAVFVDGCFWHSCPRHATVPKANRDWWEAKLRANVERDRRQTHALETAGWSVVRVWEHEDPVEGAGRVELASRSSTIA